ncbi:MAG TPA: type I restriction enzyme HsdR N-terminal domain-containing protein [Chitinophagaceae bacterium]|nr:type I restriction enzyme HsdR N-terminal domain-containing protein [Chitinophagaceae bacterium]
MVVINYPEPDFRVKKQNGFGQIFDSLRKKWVSLTPEEWVRQNFINYLVVEKKYPPSLIGIEKEIVLGELKKRFDVLVYNSAHKPWLMVECKAIDVMLDENVLQQVLRYNLSVPVNYIVITNGNNTMAWEKGDTGLHEILQLPPWQ